jgi:oligoendopeptidase F
MLYTLPKKGFRKYLDEKFNPANKIEVEEILNKLTNTNPSSFIQAKEWFGLFHEFSCAISEMQSILELNLNLDNANKNHNINIINFESGILSQLLESRDKMLNIYLNSPFKYSMHSFDSKKIESELLHKKRYSQSLLTPLQMEENLIIRKYKSFINQANVNFLGKKHYLSQVAGKMNAFEIETRKNAFLCYWNYIEKNEEIYQDIFDKLLQNRRKQAQIVGAQSYTKIAFLELNRFDYSELDCEKFRNSIIKEIVPIISNFASKQAKSLNEENISPWNCQFWPEILPQLNPSFGNSKIFIENIKEILQKIHPLCLSIFNEMQKENLISIFPREKKSSGAFSVTLHESQKAYLFGNFGVNWKDSFTFFHEFGHCLHSYASSQIDNILLRQTGFEFCEFASIAFELLASEHLECFTNDSSNIAKARKTHLFNMLHFWPFMAMIDEWQHEVYSNTKFLNKNDRNDLWLSLSKKYRPHLNWENFPEIEKLGWLARPHVFTSPFYFIDYGIGQIGALQLWNNYKLNPNQTINQYFQSLSLGGQLPLPKLFSEAGIEFSFDEELMKKLGNFIQNEIFT